jgi:hypothetical protein
MLDAVEAIIFCNLGYSGWLFLVRFCSFIQAEWPDITVDRSL